MLSSIGEAKHFQGYIDFSCIMAKIRGYLPATGTSSANIRESNPFSSDDSREVINKTINLLSIQLEFF